MDDQDTPTDLREDLDPRDAALFDQLVEAGFDVDALEGVDDATRSRACRLLAMIELVDEYPVEPMTNEQQEMLVAATLARVNREEASQQDRMHLDPGGRLPRLRFREFIAVAAVLILGLAIILPMIRSTSQREGIASSQARLVNLHGALEAFENSNDGESPSTQLEDPEYNDILGYAPTTMDMNKCFGMGLKQEALNNPLHPAQPGKGFSFHSQQSRRIVRIKFDPKMVIISDRNQLLDGVLAGQPCELDKLFRACVLLNDGHTDLSPCHVEQDHIWDCDRQREAGKPMLEIFLIHSKSPSKAGVSKKD